MTGFEASFHGPSLALRNVVFRHRWGVPTDYQGVACQGIVPIGLIVPQNTPLSADHPNRYRGERTNPNSV